MSGFALCPNPGPGIHTGKFGELGSDFATVSWGMGLGWQERALQKQSCSLVGPTLSFPVG